MCIYLSKYQTLFQSHFYIYTFHSLMCESSRSLSTLAVTSHSKSSCSKRQSLTCIYHWTDDLKMFDSGKSRALFYVNLLTSIFSSLLPFVYCFLCSIHSPTSEKNQLNTSGKIAYIQGFIF